MVEDKFAWLILVLFYTLLLNKSHCDALIYLLKSHVKALFGHICILLFFDCAVLHKMWTKFLVQSSMETHVQPTGAALIYPSTSAFIALDANVTLDTQDPVVPPEIDSEPLSISDSSIPIWIWIV